MEHNTNTDQGYNVEATIMSAIHAIEDTADYGRTVGNDGIVRYVDVDAA